MLIIHHSKSFIINLKHFYTHTQTTSPRILKQHQNYLYSTNKTKLMQPLINPKQLKFYDIAANLTDQMFSGIYHNKPTHPDDRHQVIQRALNIGCDHLLIAAGNIQDAIHSYQICNKYQNCYVTIGVHPCRAKQPFDLNKANTVDQYFQKLEIELNRISDKLVAIGECGLDYDRLQWSTKQQQLKVFPYHFHLAQKYKLPMYLHNRNTSNDFYQIVRKNRDRFSNGVVHSFTGTQQQLKQILQLDLYVGINGCSLKTQQNLQVLKKIPLEKLMIQTDSPYCQIKNTHASNKFVKTKFTAKDKKKKKPEELTKGRNQPCRIIQVLEVLSAVMQIDPEEIAKVTYQNSIKMFKK